MSDVERVQQYLEENSLLGSLIFKDLPEDFKENTENLPLKEFVMEVLDKTVHYESLNEEGLCETKANASRSVEDIWRHIKYFRPDVTIFEVMNVIGQNKDKFVGNYCGGVKRRVFRTRRALPDWALLHQDFTDELGLKFSEWSNINL
jgi:hypothetical protein